MIPIRDKTGKTFERDVNKMLVGGRLTPGSGSLWGSKGDVSNRFANAAWWSGVMIEAKSTGNKSYSLKKGVLKTVQDNALAEGKLAVVAVEISGDTYGIVELQTLMDLINLAQKLSSLGMLGAILDE
jgi:hypothetical protein